MKKNVNEMIRSLTNILTEKKAETLPPSEFLDIEGYESLYHLLLEFREVLISTSKGDLEYSVKSKGFLPDTLKNLQASLKHLALCTRELASGDFTQRIDFMGELTDAFNQMTKQLEQDFNDISRLETESRELKEHFEQIFHTSPEPTLISRFSDGLLINVNQAFLNITGYSKEEVINKTAQEINLYEHFGDRNKLIDSINKFGFCDNLEINFNKKNGGIINTLFSSKVIKLNSMAHLIIVARDITDRKVAEEKLENSEKQLRLLISQMQQGLVVLDAVLDHKGDIVDHQFINVNKYFEAILHVKASDILGKCIRDTMPEIDKSWFDIFSKVSKSGEPIQSEIYENSVNKTFSVSAYSPTELQCAVIISDITEKKKAEEEIEYLSYHDQLTGLYNRRYYKNELVRLNSREEYCPLSLIMADVNGLKLTNDAFGHIAGDALLTIVANVFRKECRDKDIIARIGGDEFVVLLPNTDKEKTNTIVKRIENAITKEKMDKVILSVSMGVSVKTDMHVDLNEVFKEAEDNMYQNKLVESAEMKRKTLKRIMDILYNNNSIERTHSNNVSQYSEAIAKKLNLSPKDIEKIRNAALMHDIGKIALDSHILYKTGSLTLDEWNEVKRHSEIGYRILNSVDEYSDYAKYALEHHEKWDGTGYPKGLKEYEISLEARIIAIADAYDAMTSTRPFRNAYPIEKAIRELRENSGTQFDPVIADLFIKKVLKK